MFARVPKASPITYNPIWMLMNKKCYDLALELKAYMLSDYLIRQFPVLEMCDYHENTLALHVNLVTRRMVSGAFTKKNEKTSRASKDAKEFLFACQAYLFPEFANQHNKKYPADSFADFFIENYKNRTAILEPQVDQVELDIETLSQAEFSQSCKQMVKAYIFLNKLEIDSQIIAKYVNYYLAHRNYLNSLSYEDFLSCKIFWGLQEEMKKIE